jgi:hypothetical protein
MSGEGEDTYDTDGSDDSYSKPINLINKSRPISLLANRIPLVSVRVGSSCYHIDMSLYL